MSTIRHGPPASTAAAIRFSVSSSLWPSVTIAGVPPSVRVARPRANLPFPTRGRLASMKVAGAVGRDGRSAAVMAVAATATLLAPLRLR